MEYVFYLLCGLLYLVGIPFGWSYEETSIYVCIYLWPILCCISTVPIFWGSVRILPKIKGFVFTFLSIFYSLIYVDFTIRIIIRYSIKNPYSFTNCMIDLKVLAECFGMSYETLNILIYVVLFALIIAFNYGIYKFLNIIRKREENRILQPQINEEEQDKENGAEI